MHESIAGAQTLFDGDRLTLARNLRGLRKVDLAEEIGLTPAAVSQYERGSARPSRQTLARIALALRLPPEFFQYGRPSLRCSEEQFHFRSLRDTTKLQRQQMLAFTQLLAEFVQGLSDWVELPAVTLSSDVASEATSTPLSFAQIERLADQARSSWGLGTGPIDHMVVLLESKGCVVSRLELGTLQVDAYSGWAGGRPIVILASDKADAARSRFDAAHELGHLLMHHDVEPGSAAAEREAQYFAGAFLMPRASFRKELPGALDWRLYVDLKRRWGVSIAAQLKRAENLGILGGNAYRRAMRHLSAVGWRTREPGDLVSPEQPTVLPRAFAIVLQEFGDAERVGRLVGVSGTELTRFIPDGKAIVA
jgi:Zn-dependent peptidase ImmA (M78 family)/DNA-binding XRE family transcriptional regulator